MIRPIVTMSQDEQDRYYSDVMSKLDCAHSGKLELKTLMATMYLNGFVSSYMVKNICPSYKTNENAVRKLRNAGASIEYKGNKFTLKGFEDGEPCFMHFKNTYAPHIKVAL